MYHMYHMYHMYWYHMYQIVLASRLSVFVPQETASIAHRIILKLVELQLLGPTEGAGNGGDLSGLVASYYFRWLACR